MLQRLNTVEGAAVAVVALHACRTQVSCKIYCVAMCKRPAVAANDAILTVTAMQHVVAAAVQARMAAAAEDGTAAAGARAAAVLTGSLRTVYDRHSSREATCSSSVGFVVRI